MSREFIVANSSYLSTPSSAVYNNMTKWTHAMWVYPRSAGESSFGVFFVKDPNNFGSPGAFFDGSGNLSIYASVGSGANFSETNTTTQLDINTWNHVAFTFDSTTDNIIRIYKNGVEMSYSLQTSAAVLPDDSSEGYVFGGTPAFPATFDGYMAETVIFNVALSSMQVSQLATSTTGATGIADGNLVAYWHLCGIQSPEPDSSGNGNSATLNGVIPAGPDSPGFSCSAPSGMLLAWLSRYRKFINKK